MSVNGWKIKANVLHAKIVKWPVNSAEDKRFLALALCGEAGELANLVKKVWRGDPLIPLKEIRKELADVRIYLELLAEAFECDLDQECEQKMTEVEARYAR